MNTTPWGAIGITIVVLLALGLINDKMQRIAIIAAVIIAITLILKKVNG